jgi:hypothetical protein
LKNIIYERSELIINLKINKIVIKRTRKKIKRIKIEVKILKSIFQI